MLKRTFSSFTLKEAMQLIGRDLLLRWNIVAPAPPPSDFLREALRRRQVGELENTEAAKVLLIDGDSVRTACARNAPYPMGARGA